MGKRETQIILKTDERSIHLRSPCAKDPSATRKLLPPPHGIAHHRRALTISVAVSGGAHSVGIWAGLFIFNSSDMDDESPFLTIKDVHDLDYFWIKNVPDGELFYDANIVPDELARSIGLRMCGRDGGMVTINGVTYVRQNALRYCLAPDAAWRQAPSGGSGQIKPREPRRPNPPQILGV
jgi:hypothetical protein